MTDRLSDRFLLLLEKTSLKDLAEVNSKEYVRWQAIKRGKSRISTREIELISEMYPQYRWWLLTGDVMPEKGQTSPDYDIANSNLSSQSAG